MSPSYPRHGKNLAHVRCGVLGSRREFIEAAHQALQRRPFLLEIVTRAQVVAALEQLPARHEEAVECWCARAVELWRSQLE